MASLIFLVYSMGRKQRNGMKMPDGITKLWRRVFSGRTWRISSKQASTNVVEASGPFNFSGRYDTEASLQGTVEGNGGPISALYRRIGKRQKLAGIGFVIASIVFLGLSVPLKNVVLEVDSIVSFTVAAILFLKQSRSRVQSRVLGAIVLSLGTTIAELSARAGSGFFYSPLGKGISDVAVVNSPDTAPGDRSGVPFKVVPPGMGLAKLFARETGDNSITTESLQYLLPSVIRENFGLADATVVSAVDGKVEVLLRNPAVYCNCQNDEPKRTAVIGCTVSSFLAVLYSYASQKSLYLDRCVTDSELKTWRVSMSLQPLSH
jgi:hypothetical protein